MCEEKSKNILEDEALYAIAKSRLKKGNLIWIAAEDVLVNMAEEENPYKKMADEELFS